MSEVRYRVSYRYIDPPRGGPMKGHDIRDERPVKGDLIYATFGRAIVTSVSRSKE